MESTNDSIHVWAIVQCNRRLEQATVEKEFFPSEYSQPDGNAIIVEEQLEKFIFWQSPGEGSELDQRKSIVFDRSFWNILGAGIYSGSSRTDQRLNGDMDVSIGNQYVHTSQAWYSIRAIVQRSTATRSMETDHSPWATESVSSVSRRIGFQL